MLDDRHASPATAERTGTLMSGNEFQKDVVGIGVKPVAPQLQRYICHDRRQLGGSLRTCLGRNPGRGPRPYSQDSGRLSGATGGEAHFNGRLSRSTSHPRILHDPNKGLRKSSEHLYQARKRGRCIANASYRRKGKSSTTRLQPPRTPFQSRKESDHLRTRLQTHILRTWGFLDQ